MCTSMYFFIKKCYEIRETWLKLIDSQVKITFRAQWAVKKVTLTDF